MGKKFDFITKIPGYLKVFFGGLDENKNSMGDDLKKAFAHLEKKKVIMAISAVLFLSYFFSGIYLVGPGEVAVVRQFGKIINDRVSEGLRYRFPWPIEQLDKVNVTQIRREGIGVSLPEHLPKICPPGELQLLTGDENIVKINMVIQYKIKNIAEYLFKVKYESYGLVRNVIKCAANEIIGYMSINDILTTGKMEAQNQIFELSQRVLDEYKSGIQIVSVNFEEIAPPEEVADAFREVAGAKIEKEKLINEAEGYFNSIIPQARGEAQRLISQAEGYKEDAVNRAMGDAEKYRKVYREYVKNLKKYSEDTTKQRLFLETVEKVMPKSTIYVVDNVTGEKINLRFMNQK